MIENAKFSGHCFYMKTNIEKDFRICISVPLNMFKNHQGSSRMRLMRLNFYIASRLLQVARNSKLSEYRVGLITSYFSINIISKGNSFFMIKLFNFKKLNFLSACCALI